MPNPWASQSPSPPNMSNLQIKNSLAPFGLFNPAISQDRAKSAAESLPFGGPLELSHVSESLSDIVNTTEIEETKYSAQLQLMHEMGFINDEENLRALMATDGDVDLAVSLIINLNQH
jgi:hypothetical protein